jgi:hypothetical protein
MEYPDTDELHDGEFLRLVESGRIERFGHREHLRLAFLAVRREQTLDQAIERCRSGIRAVATAQGAPDRYHETITAAWATIVGSIASARPAATFDELLDRHPELRDPHLLERYYSRERLASDEARRRRLAPDVLPMPRAGRSDAGAATRPDRRARAAC